jgi:6-phosphofructokinase 2
MKKITTLTMNPCVDLSAEIDRVEPIKKLRCSKSRWDPGGGGINVARAIHILGGKAAAYFTCGGVTGDMLQKMLQKQEIENHPLKVTAVTRESFAVRETETGDQYRFVMPGDQLQEDEWHHCLEVMVLQKLQPDFLVASGSLPQGVPADFYARLAAGLDKAKTRFIVDTSGEPLQATLAAGVYMIKPNLRELQEVSGGSLEDEKEQEEFCRELVEKGGTEVIILSLGHNGALFTDRHRQIRLKALDIEVDSPIGAGDSFVAGVVYALARGMDQERAFYYGMAAGTAALVTPGTELCRREETEKYYRRLLKQQG